MKITRRDLVLVATGATAASIGGIWLGERDGLWERQGRDSITDEDVETLQAVAEVIYPSGVETTDEIAEAYATALHRDRRREVTRAIDELNHEVQRTHGRQFTALDPGQRESVLRGLGVRQVRPIASGSVPERIRFYLVNGLLYALFTDPVGTGLLGVENPLGYPGGYESALRGTE